MTARGIKNNNPMNIRMSSNKWEGKVPINQNTDGTFEQFKTPEDGIRAGAKLLITYHVHYHRNTVRELITRFAPSADNNNTEAYIDFVAKKLGVKEDTQLDVDSYKTMYLLVTSIIDFENPGAGCPYPESVIRNALKRAGVAETPNKKLMDDPVIKSTALASAPTIATVANAVSPFSDVLTALATNAPWIIAGIAAVVIIYIVVNKVMSIKQGKE